MSTEIQLAPPGAGLPFVELFFSRIAFMLFRWMTTNEQATRMFLAEGRRMVEMVRNVNPERGKTQVLIPRITGIEDSSRNWSSYMVFDHLRIVNAGLARIIDDLGLGSPSLTVPGTAQLKPDAGAGPDVVGKFEIGLQEYTSTVVSILEKRSKERHAHPWFGPLDSHGWHCLAAFHQRVHRRHLSFILERLPVVKQLAAR